MEKFRKQMQQRLDEMIATGKLYRANVSGGNLWNTYLDSFDNDPVFRDPEKSLHDCNHCNNFMRRYGNIVAFDKDYNLMTLFDFVPEEEEFYPVVQGLMEQIKSSEVRDVFFETFEELNALPYESCKKNAEVYKLGVDENVKRYTSTEAKMYGVVKPDELRTFKHMFLMLPKEYVLRNKGSIQTIMAKYRDDKQVFQRAMEDITLDTLELVYDLIKQGSLLDGATHLSTIAAIIPFKKAYDKLTPKQRNGWCWKTSYDLPQAKFKNTLIGVLCTELSEGEEINKACQNWNKRVDPANYMKAKAPISTRQIKEAKLFITDNGYETAFKRRPATIDDIKADEILHLNSEGGEETPDVSIFDGVEATKSTQHKRSEFDGVEEVNIETFMHSILPGCTSVEILLKNHHNANMVTLTTASTKESKQIFKWDNNYSWTYNGNLAGKSLIKEAVRVAGGQIDGVLNFRLAWNDDKEAKDSSDLDAWAMEPNGRKIGYSTSYRKDRSNTRTPFSGQLDVDNMNPQGLLAVENITWNDFSAMPDGEYKLWVHQYAGRNSKGFKAEIEYLGSVYTYAYNHSIRQKDKVPVARIIFKDRKFSIKHDLKPIDGEGVVKEIYTLKTNHFHKVNLACLSPNHWGGNTVGNKHYFFFLEGAQAKTSLRSFHNENLKSDLRDHRKVMEVLANTTMVDSKPKELSGLGFNATVRDEIIVRLKGSHKRVIKLKF